MTMVGRRSPHPKVLCKRCVKLQISIVFVATTLRPLPTASPYSIFHNNKNENLLQQKAKVVIPLYPTTSMQVASIQTVRRKSTSGSQFLVRSTSRDIESSAISEYTNKNHTSLSEYSNMDDSPLWLVMEDDKNYGNDIHARSMFGTKEYWDDLYIGRGDFPADTYSWYTNWNELQHYIKHYTSATSGTAAQQRGKPTTIITTAQTRSQSILIPGIGNDSLLIDMIRAGYNQQHTLVVQDYSYHAIERQMELLQSIGCSNYMVFRGDKIIGNPRIEDDVTVSTMETKRIYLYCCDITKKLPSTWDHSFDMIVEKGLLDAVYLSDDTNSNIQDATRNIYQSLKSNGILISISSVIPTELRQTYFPSKPNNDAPSWEWIRDGSIDVNKAGCFILRKLQ